MKVPFLKLPAVLAAALVLALSLPGSAFAFSVRPVVVDMTPSGRGSVTTVVIENAFDRPITVEISAAPLIFGEATASPDETETDDFVVFPPQAIIEPGRSQSVRIQYVGDPDLSESKHYFVTVAQVPVQLEEGQTAIQILYNFRVLTNVGVIGASPDIKVVGAQPAIDDQGRFRPSIQFRNDGPTYGYLVDGRMTIRQTSPSGEVIFDRSIRRQEMEQMLGVGLVGPNKTRTVMIPVDLPSAEGTIVAEFANERTR